MSNERFTFSEVDLALAIRGLREALGRSQEVMAELIGCSLPAYQKWETGKLIPEGDWLIRMLRLCPDEETRNAFRIRAERRHAPRERRFAALAPDMSGAGRDACRSLAIDAITAICQCGEAGIEAADARLAEFASALHSAAEYYRSELEKRRTS